MRASMAVLIGVLLAAGAPPAAADETALIARNLAEGILGKGVVKTSRVSADGRALSMVWESATYKPSNPPAHTRELLKVEADFASASVFRVLTRIRQIDFEITLGARSLCTGRASRDVPMHITYARDLGG